MEDFVGTHPCKLRGILRSRLLRVLRGTKFDNSDNILRNLLAVELRGVNIYGVLPGGVAGGQQISSPCLTLGFARLT